MINTAIAVFLAFQYTETINTLNKELCAHRISSMLVEVGACPEDKDQKMIPKEHLKVAHYYFGHCRNSNIARWDGERFWYWREKFGTPFLEQIDYFSAGEHFDTFQPVEDVTWGVKEIPLEQIKDNQ
jgi:hypothetical protein